MHSPNRFKRRNGKGEQAARYNHLDLLLTDTEGIEGHKNSTGTTMKALQNFPVASLGFGIAAGGGRISAGFHGLHSTAMHCR